MFFVLAFYLPFRLGPLFACALILWSLPLPDWFDGYLPAVESDHLFRRFS